MSRSGPLNRFATVGAFALTVFLIAGPCRADDHDTDLGKQVYMRANCVGCHKWYGGGGGGYGGAAASLRKTKLTKEQIEMTVTCGRPGTGMPYFGRDSYPTDPSKKGPCYGLSRDDLKGMALAQGGTFLRPEEVDAVTEYVIHHIKGKGEPDLADCTAFFGTHSSVCDVYEPNHHHVMPTPSTTE